MYAVKKLINTFAYILTGTTISSALYITVFAPKYLFNDTLLWEIVAISAVCALGNFIYHHKNTLSKRQMMIRLICHYIYINAVVVGGAILFSWLIPVMLTEILVMLLLIAIVYVIITMVTFRQEEKTARDLNRRLRDKFPAYEEGEESKNSSHT